MGMFDYLQCDYSIPGQPENIDHYFQTKDTPSQSLDKYKICNEGYLWHEDYETEYTRVPGTNNILHATLSKRSHIGWKKCDDFSGTLNFYTHDVYGNWWEYSAQFNNGLLISLKLVEFPGFGGNFGDELIKEKI